MKAMIFAAGLGTRLRPLTDNRPKALIEINNVPLLEIVLRRLISVGVDAAIINTHHFPDQIASFLKTKNNFDIRIELSYEEQLLDTGGGLKKASYFFDDDQPFIVHNVDIISDIDLLAMREQHLRSKALATLAVKQRKTSRYLIFNETGLLCGWKSLKENRTEMVRAEVGRTIDLGFGGIHIISPALFDKMKETGVFSIVETYLRLAGLGEKIFAFRTDGNQWHDVGKLEQLQRLC